MRVMLLAAAFGGLCLAPLPASADPCAGVFIDVDSTATYCPAVAFIKNKGVTSGCTANQFCPDQFVTRAQMALFMQRLARGGATNTLDDPTGVIGGGGNNVVNANYATVGGGEFNSATGVVSTVSGGTGNTANGDFSTVSGGGFNTAGGMNSFAAGYRAKATHDGAFVWSDHSNYDFVSTAINAFDVRATGGVKFTVAVNSSGFDTESCTLASGTPGWQCTSDRNAKQDFVEADGAAVLDRLASVPVYTYSMKGADPGIRSMGPTAQDFRAAFGLGSNDRTIATINLEGVALAAIKGLDAKLAAKEAEIAELRSRLEVLERTAAR